MLKRSASWTVKAPFWLNTVSASSAAWSSVKPPLMVRNTLPLLGLPISRLLASVTPPESVLLAVMLSFEALPRVLSMMPPTMVPLSRFKLPVVSSSSRVSPVLVSVPVMLTWPFRPPTPRLRVPI